VHISPSTGEAGTGARHKSVSVLLTALVKSNYSEREQPRSNGRSVRKRLFGKEH
jgi:hypothetical protein